MVSGRLGQYTRWLSNGAKQRNSGFGMCGTGEIDGSLYSFMFIYTRAHIIYVNTVWVYVYYMQVLCVREEVRLTSNARLSTIRFLRGIQILLPATTSRVMNWREHAETFESRKITRSFLSKSIITSENRFWNLPRCSE